MSFFELVIAAMLVLLAMNQRILNSKLNDIRLHLGVPDKPKKLK